MSSSVEYIDGTSVDPIAEGDGFFMVADVGSKVLTGSLTSMW